MGQVNEEWKSAWAHGQEDARGSGCLGCVVSVRGWWPVRARAVLRKFSASARVGSGLRYELR